MAWMGFRTKNSLMNLAILRFVWSSKLSDAALCFCSFSMIVCVILRHRCLKSSLLLGHTTLHLSHAFW